MSLIMHNRYLKDSMNLLKMKKLQLSSRYINYLLKVKNLIYLLKKYLRLLLMTYNYRIRMIILY